MPVKHANPPIIQGDVIREAFGLLDGRGQTGKKALIKYIERRDIILDESHYYSLKDFENQLRIIFGENAVRYLISRLESGVQQVIESRTRRACTGTLCAHILGIDKGIRFVGIVGSTGEFVARVYREGLSPLLNENEAKLAVAHTMMCAQTQRPLERSLGRAIFSYTLFENVKRVTLDIITELDETGVMILFLDTNVDHERVVNEILPLLDGLALQNPL